MTRAILLAIIVGCRAPRSPEIHDADDTIAVAADSPTEQPAMIRCRTRGPLPDPTCTPGAVFAVTVEQICAPGYSKTVRNVPARTKREVLFAYGVTVQRPGEYEIDHLISLELGGSNDQANLWPEAAEPRPGFHEKDRIENELHRRLCRGEVSLLDVQRAIATDWSTALQRVGAR